MNYYKLISQFWSVKWYVDGWICYGNVHATNVNTNHTHTITHTMNEYLLITFTENSFMADNAMEIIYGIGSQDWIEKLRIGGDSLRDNK